MMELFSKHEIISDLQTEAQRLKNEIGEITREIRFLAKPPDPRQLEQLQLKRTKMMKQLQPIEQQIREQEEKTALSKVETLVRENQHDIIIKVDGTRVKPNENGEVVIRHTCGHEIKIPVYELFRHQTRIDTNQKLLSFWETVINNKESHTKIYICEKCKREREAYLKKHHVIPNKRSGIARVTIQVI